MKADKESPLIRPGRRILYLRMLRRVFHERRTLFQGAAYCLPMGSDLRSFCDRPD